MVAVWLFVVGLYGVITSRNYIHLVVCLGGRRVLPMRCCWGPGSRTNSVAPVFLDLPVGTPAVDPIVHALMLVDVVVEATVFAVLMALVIKAHGRTGTLDPDDLEVMRG